MTEAVPLRRGLQRHKNHVVRTANPVGKVGRSKLRVKPARQHRVNRVRPAAPPALRSVCVELLGERKGDARRTKAAPSIRLSSVRKFSVPSTSSSPQRPRFEQRKAAAAIAPSGSFGSSDSALLVTLSTPPTHGADGPADLLTAPPIY